MSPEILYRVFHGTSAPTAFQKSLLTIRPAILHDYARRRVQDADYPAIYPSPAAQASSEEEEDPSAASTSSPQQQQQHHHHHQSTSSVRGTVVTGLTDGDIWRLDIFEGSEYERRKVEVKLLVKPSGEVLGAEGGSALGGECSTVEGETVSAETYVWIAGIDSLDLREWDFEEFVREKMDRWLGTDEYEEVDEAVEATGKEDPTGGRGRGGSITKRLQDAV